MNENDKAFVVYISFLRSKMTIHRTRQAQLALLLFKKVNGPAEYPDFAYVFLEKSANVLSEQTRVNKYTIKLEEGKQPPYGPIYSLEPVELKTLKTYIVTYLANGFIRTSKSLAGTPILFVCKPNSKLSLLCQLPRSQ